MSIAARRAPHFEVTCDLPGCEEAELLRDDPRATGKYPPGWLPIDAEKARLGDGAKPKRSVQTFHSREHLALFLEAAGVALAPPTQHANIQRAPAAADSAPEAPLPEAGAPPATGDAGPTGEGPIKGPRKGPEPCPSRCQCGLACFKTPKGHPGRHECNDEHKWGAAPRGGSGDYEDDDDDTI